MAPSLIQVASNKATSGNLTVTLGSPTTPGNTLVALIGTCADTNNGSISGITLGGSADNWAHAADQGSGPDHAWVFAWVDPSCAGGQTSVVITQTGASGTVQGIEAYVFEWAGLPGPVDVSSGSANTFSATWTSGTTGATAQASEVAFGVTCGASNTRPPGVTGPSSPWVNEPQIFVAGTSRDKALMCGYQILSSTGTQTYAGTSSPTTTNDTLVFTLKAASGTAHTATAALTVTPAAAITKGVGRGVALAVHPAAAATKGVGRGVALAVRPATAVATSGGHRPGGYQIVPALVAMGVI